MLFRSVGGIGGGYLATILTNFSERARRHVQETGETATEESIRGELADQIARALYGEAGAGLRAEVASVLRGVDAVRAALAADRNHALALGLAALGEQVADFGQCSVTSGRGWPKSSASSASKACPSAVTSWPLAASWR